MQASVWTDIFADHLAGTDVPFGKVPLYQRRFAGVNSRSVLVVQEYKEWEYKGFLWETSRGHPSGRIDFWRIWESIAIQPLLRNKSSYCLDCLQILLVCIPSLRKNLSIDSLYDDFPCVDGYMAALIKLHNQFTQGRDVHSRTRLLFAIPKKAHAAM